MKISFSFKFAILWLVIIGAPLSLSAKELLWATPTYATTEPVKQVIVVNSQFNYHLFVPANKDQKLRLLQRKYANVDTAEDALISRFSAISSLDYQWWLDTWQPSSQQLALAFFQQKGLDKKYWLETWKKQFVGRKIKLKYKIEHQGYVIFTYNVSEPDGREGFLDVPIVFNHTTNKWLVSLDIRQSPLLRYSPWVSGIKEETVIYE